MRWSIVRLIWLRELRDQLRDRRTVFMIAVLPVLLYPVAGFGVLQLAAGFLNQKTTVGVVGADRLHPWAPARPRQAVAALAAAPPGPGGPLAAVDRFCAAAALTHVDPRPPYPPLLAEVDGRLSARDRYRDRAGKARPLALVPLPAAPSADAVDRTPLERHEVDVLLVVPPGFQEGVEFGGRPRLVVLARAKDDTSRLADVRVTAALNRWKRDLRETRLERHGLPPDFDEPFAVTDPARDAAAPPEKGLVGLMVRVFPFILVMWSLAGALYPAVDLCAGEKERGTMETLLISPAAREEIVYGKFLTIWVFSAGTALLNLLSMGLTTAQFGGAVPGDAFRPAALGWAVLLLLPLSAFFSAVCLAVGAYARSSKEGQYYLMPLFLVTMPLIFLTLAPGVDLNPFYSMVPVTGVALLLQKLMAADGGGRTLWLYFVPVLAPTVLYSWLALRWAVSQFQREEVLFREAERLDLGLWLRRLFREKEALPSAGEALFCFAAVLLLHRFNLSVAARDPMRLAVQLGVGYLAFVATPPLFMALLLTTRPRAGLALRLPPAWAWPAALGLAVLLFVPGVEVTYLVMKWLGVEDSLRREYQNAVGGGAGGLAPELVLPTVLGLALVQALCEELAFRGFILSGLRQRFRPWTAVLLSSFLFALFQMNVFQFVPHFLLGVVLGALVLRTGSLLPAVVFHLAYNSLVYTCLAVGPSRFPRFFEAVRYDRVAQAPYPLVRLAVSLGCVALAAALLARLLRRAPARPEALPADLKAKPP